MAADTAADHLAQPETDAFWERNTSILTTLTATVLAHLRSYDQYLYALFAAKMLDAFSTVTSLTLVTHTYEARVLTARVIEATSIPVGNALVGLLTLPLLITCALGGTLLAETFYAHFTSLDDQLTPAAAALIAHLPISEDTVQTAPQQFVQLYMQNFPVAIYLTATIYFAYLGLHNFYLAFILPM